MVTIRARLLLLLLLLIGVSSGQKTTGEKIWKAIGYKADTPKFLPSLDDSTVKLDLGLVLLSVSDIDEVTGTAKVTYWAKMLWSDKGMKWDAKALGAKSINVGTDMIWVPDIVPYNAETTSQAFDTSVVVRSTGELIWVPQISSKIRCVTSKKAFPEEERICSLKLGSWTYSDSQLNASLGETDTSFMEEFKSIDAGWKFVSVTAKRTAKTYPCCPDDKYVDVTWNITIRREDLYFGMSTAVPSAALGLVVSLLYLIYPSNPARIVTQTICLFILTFLCVSHLPTNLPLSYVPIAAVFYVGAEVLALIAIIWSIVACVIWQQAHGSSGQGSGALTGLECILLLKMRRPKHAELDGEGKTDRNRHPLSKIQRVFLIVDRLLCIISVILIIIFLALLRS